MSWRDDLPPIPAERMLADAVREGTRRLERRRERRQRAMVFGGLGVVAAVGLVFAAASGIFTGVETDDGDAAMPTEAAATAPDFTEAPAETAAEGTEAPEATEPEATEAPEATEPATEAPEATEPAATVAPEATEPPEIVASEDVAVQPSQVWELPASGPSCGPATVEVVYAPRDRTLARAIVVWAGAFGVDQTSMNVVANVASATIGPFPTGTIGDDATSEDVFVIVVAFDTEGDVAVRRSPVDRFSLTECSP